RDFHVTGVQTCALPICSLAREAWPHSAEPFSRFLPNRSRMPYPGKFSNRLRSTEWPEYLLLSASLLLPRWSLPRSHRAKFQPSRSEERRVGKECISRVP